MLTRWQDDIFVNKRSSKGKKYKTRSALVSFWDLVNLELTVICFASKPIEFKTHNSTYVFDLWLFLKNTYSFVGNICYRSWTGDILNVNLTNKNTLEHKNYHDPKWKWQIQKSIKFRTIKPTSIHEYYWIFNPNVPMCSMTTFSSVLYGYNLFVQCQINVNISGR